VGLGCGGGGGGGGGVGGGVNFRMNKLAGPKNAVWKKDKAVLESLREESKPMNLQ